MNNDIRYNGLKSVNDLLHILARKPITMLFAPAALRLDEYVEVLLPVIIGKLGPRHNPLARKNEDLVARPDCLAVRHAGVVDIPGQIRGDIPVDHLFCIHFEKISSLALPHLLLAEHAAGVFDNANPFRDCLFGKKTLAGLRAAH